MALGSGSVMTKDIFGPPKKIHLSIELKEPLLVGRMIVEGFMTKQVKNKTKNKTDASAMRLNLWVEHAVQTKKKLIIV